MHKKRLLLLVLFFAVFLGWSQTAEAATSNLSVNSITGSVYRDINENGEMELKLLEVAISNQQVSLYQTLEDAQANQHAVKTTKTNSLGSYTFSGLKNGSYFLRYDFSSDYKATTSYQTAVDASGTPIPGIVKVEVEKISQLIFPAQLPLKKVTNLEILPFNDQNWNGVMDENEPILDGKTMIVINLRKFAEVVKAGDLSSINVSQLVAGALDGNVDLIDGIHLRTTKNGQLINLPEAESDLYVMIRSPFNLTLSGMAENSAKISALIEILTGGDISKVLDNPTLISTGDIDTNSDNTYIKLLAEFLPKIADEIDKIDYASVLGEENAATFVKTSSTLRKLGSFVDHIPAMRFAKVDYFGNAYDLTGLKLKKTQQYYFGIKSYATLSGQVFNDSNFDGKKGTLEGLKSVELSVYDENGQVVASTKSPSLLGEFSLSELPYDQNLYLGITETAPVYPELMEGKPEALADKKIVAVYNFNAVEGETTFKQNIGIANLTAISVDAKSVGQSATVLTFRNKNSVAVTVDYLVNGTQAGTLDIKAKGLLAKEATADLSLGNLMNPGENILQATWTTGLYSGELAPIQF